MLNSIYPLMKIAIGADHAGFSQGESAGKLAREATKWSISARAAQSCDYPDFAQSVGAMSRRGAATGILVCSQNRYGNSRQQSGSAPLLQNDDEVKFTREHNDANVNAGREIWTLPARWN
jgi:ribose 5-phosphate isomerase B